MFVCDHFTENVIVLLADLISINNMKSKKLSLNNSNSILFFVTSVRTLSTSSSCFIMMCFRTNSGPRNFLPLSGHSHLSLANSWVLALMKFSTSLEIGKICMCQNLIYYNIITLIIIKYIYLHFSQLFVVIYNLFIIKVLIVYLVHLRLFFLLSKFGRFLISCNLIFHRNLVQFCFVRFEVFVH